MSLFDFLKRKKEVEKAKEKKPKKIDQVSVAEKPAKEKKNSPSTKLRKDKKEGNFSYEIIKEPHISEKSTMLAGENRYVFKVYPLANKTEIKKAVEGIYGVDVLSVNVVKIPEKKRRLGKVEGWKKGHRKAIVKIKEGQKIEIL